MSFKIGNCNIIISPLFVSALCVILLIDRTGIMLFGILAMIIHETGHLCFMIISKKYPQTISFQLGGIIIKSRGFSGYNYDFLIALGGCLFNFTAIAIACVYYYETKSEMSVLFAAANFGLMFFNLLPVNGLDGMDLIRLRLLKKHSIEKASRICNLISIVFLSFSILISVFAVINFSLNPTIVVSLLYLFILTLINIKQNQSQTV